MRRRFKLAVRDLLATARLCHTITPWRRPGYLGLLRRALRVCRSERFEPGEAYRFGLYRRPPRPGERCSCGSRKSLTKLQKALSPLSVAESFRSKIVFYRHCEATGVPVGRTYALCYGDGSGLIWPDRPLDGRRAWREFLAVGPADEFVVKLGRSASSSGFSMFHRCEGGFAAPSGEMLTHDAFCDRLIASAGADGALLQHRLFNHPILVRLSGTRHLQTTRFITLIDRNGQCRIIHTNLKVIVGDRITDTFAQGRAATSSASSTRTPAD